jgi:hypothetical protein
MPLNPPSYKGQDVYYSPDTWVNQVPVALWQIPQSNNVSTDKLSEATFQGCSIDGPATPESLVAAQQYQQALVNSGLLSQQSVEQGEKIQQGLGASDTKPPPNTPTLGNDTGGVENSTSFPGTLQLSRSFTLGQLTLKPYVVFPHPVRDFSGLSQGQIVANLKLLAINVLDPVIDKFPDMRVTNTFRDNDPPRYYATNQHAKGQAADLQFTKTDKRQYFNIAQWIKDNTPFDQLILEWATGGGKSPSHWIHVSYAGVNNRPRTNRECVMTFVNHRRYPANDGFGLVDYSANFV